MRTLGGLDEPIELVNGAVTSGPSLAVAVDGLRLPNPFVIGSGPPGESRIGVRWSGVERIGRESEFLLQCSGAMLTPPASAGTNYKVMKKAFDEGWGGVICKTLSLDAAKVVNVTPRYARLKGAGGEVVGWENIELISDRPFEMMLAELRQLKDEYPDRCEGMIVWMRGRARRVGRARS